MTDRHSGYIVVLEKDIREDDAERTIEALKQIKGVIGVTPIVANSESHSASCQAYHDIMLKMYAFVKEINPFLKKVI